MNLKANLQLTIEESDEIAVVRISRKTPDGKVQTCNLQSAIFDGMSKKYALRLFADALGNLVRKIVWPEFVDKDERI